MSRKLTFLLCIVAVMLAGLLVVGCEVDDEVVDPEEPVEEEPEPEPDEPEEDPFFEEHYLWDEVTNFEEIEALREVVGADPVPITVDVEEVIEIALIFPALDLSDSWERGYRALLPRLEELNIPAEVHTMGSAHDDHVTQRSHLETVLAEKDVYDYCIVGPTALEVQSDIISDLIADPDIEVIVWNESTPLKEWGTTREEGQPLSYVAFDHYDGALVISEYIQENYDFEHVAFLHGIVGTPAAILRGYTVRDMFEDQGVEVVYEHYADWDREAAYEATKEILVAYPEVDFIHSSSTAMTAGAAAAIEEMGMTGDVILNGWGGGTEEQELLLDGQMHFTVLRNQDDWGVVLAEMIKLDLEGRQDEIPLVFTGEMVLVDHTYDREAIDEILDYAFRYSGDLEH